MQQMLGICPEEAACDLHPRYLSSAELAGADLEVSKVQHHLAHVFSAVAEYSLTGDILGLAFDGTGYGTDGNVWGSEFFCLREGADNEICADHAGSLRPVKMIGGDESSRDAQKSLYCYLYDAQERNLLKQEQASGIRDLIEGTNAESHRPADRIDHRILHAALRHDINTVYIQSMGRLFDAVSALLGICSYNTYEGECAAKLEIAAHRGRKGEDVFSDRVFGKLKESDKSRYYWLDGTAIIVELIHLMSDGLSVEDMAAGFHYMLGRQVFRMSMDIISDRGLCEPSVVLSGGTFYNRILDQALCESFEQAGIRVFQNSLVPSGDGGLALGQVYLSEKKVRIC
jgi:hydrogenase maturation protein HypF